MKLLCPQCRQILNNAFTCQNGHTYVSENDILRLMKPVFRDRLTKWLTDFEAFRAPQLRELDFDGLPSSGIGQDKYTWNARTLDWKIIQALLDQRWEKALDIGSWNGWLAHQLSSVGLDVTAIDYFSHEVDGLGARKWYQNPHWHSIQMDLEDLSIIQDRFDLIVVNRCFPYFTDAHQMINSIKQLLTEGGLILITGLNLSKKGIFLSAIEQSTNAFEANFSRSFKFKEFKGYLEVADMTYLQGESFQIRPYPNLRNRVKRLIKGRFGVSYYALWRVPSSDKQGATR